MNTRFAPSPTGKPHLGNMRTALFNWLKARAHGGKFILRIDDTDPERSREEYVDEIKYGLEWLGLFWDAEYRQSERKELYEARMNETLLDPIDGLGKLNDDGSIELNFPDDWANVSWHDELRGTMTASDVEMQRIKHAVVARSGGGVLYNYASVIDDGEMNINYIIRGDDHITNTHLQVAIWQATFHSSPPVFAHLGLIHAADGKKMAKRMANENLFFLSHYIDAGYSPDAMFNCLLRLGWGPKPDDKTTAVMTREDALRMFVDHGNLQVASAKFDLAKLDSWDRKFKARAQL